MFGRYALRLCQCIYLARQRGVLSWRIAAGSGPPVARHWQVHAPCQTETRNSRERRSSKQAHRHGVLGYKGACRKRLAQAAKPRTSLPNTAPFIENLGGYAARRQERVN